MEATIWWETESLSLATVVSIRFLKGSELSKREGAIINGLEASISSANMTGDIGRSKSNLSSSMSPLLVETTSICVVDGEDSMDS